MNLCLTEKLGLLWYDENYYADHNPFAVCGFSQKHGDDNFERIKYRYISTCRLCGVVRPLYFSYYSKHIMYNISLWKLSQFVSPSSLHDGNNNCH